MKKIITVKFRTGMKKEKDEGMDKLVDEIAKEIDEEMKNGTFKSTESEKIKYMMIFVCVLIIHFFILIYILTYFQIKYPELLG